jgi:peptidoglycan/LPS O-acetylase OafA/YrhL
MPALTNLARLSGWTPHTNTGRQEGPHNWPEQKIPQLDGIRGLAILSVVAFHYFGYPYGRTPQDPLLVRAISGAFDLGWIGVDLFFVLSGFLVGGILLDYKDSPRYFRTFYIRRSARILPLYWTWLAVYAAVFSVVGTSHLTGGAIPLAPHFVFLQNILMAKTGAWSNTWLGISWSLAIEEQFYLIIPALIFWMSRRSLRIALCIFLVASPFLRLFVIKHFGLTTGVPLYVLLPTHGDGLAIGVLLATVARSPKEYMLYLGHHRVFLAIGIACAAILLSDLIAFRTTNLSVHASAMYPVASTLLGVVVFDSVARPAALIGRLTSSSLLRFFGSISYCLYLVHEVFLAATLRFVYAVYVPKFSFDKLLWTTFALVFAVGVSVISLHVFEKPILRLARKYTY